MDDIMFNKLKIVDMLSMLKCCEITCEDIANHYITKINDLEEDISAWESFSQERLINEARKKDRWRKITGGFQPLLGIPFGIKDIIDVENYPTTRGSPIFNGYMPGKDSTIVTNIKNKGGIVCGKTVTTEFAWKHHTRTRNPWNVAHTPGGSSSGSAAAVASGMIPISLGSQTIGSTIRPASYCGVIGFKPSYKRFSLEGVSPLSQTLDHVGFFTNNIDDMIYFIRVMLGENASEEFVGDKITHQKDVVTYKHSKGPFIALIETPMWEKIDRHLREKMLASVQKLESEGANIEIINIDNIYYSGMQALDTILSFEAANNYYEIMIKNKNKFSTEMTDLVESGKRISTEIYLQAIEDKNTLLRTLKDIVSAYSLIVTPATYGAAPAGILSTGDPGLCGLWTLFGLPALSCPIGQNKDKMPLSIQFVGKDYDDIRFLEAVKWCCNIICNSA